MFMKVEIVKLDDFGRGICFVNNKVTFVPNTIPGYTVNIKINYILKTFDKSYEG